MKTCPECKGTMQTLQAKTLENIPYNYYKCQKCGEEIVDMQQLHNVAEKYRTLKRYQVKLSTWGLSLGLRIPKKLAQKYHLQDNKTVTIIPEKEGLKIVPA